MAKGPIVTPEIEARIAAVYQKHPKWKAPTVRNEVEHLLHTKNARYPKGWPSLSTVQKVLAVVRKRADMPSPQDEPWSLSTLDDYPIPPEALQRVLEEYKRCKEGGRFIDSDAFTVSPGDAFPYLTIRQAKWVARLSKVECFGAVPYLIAWRERLYEKIGKAPDLDPYDKLLAGLLSESTDESGWTKLIVDLQGLAGGLESDPECKRLLEAIDRGEDIWPPDGLLKAENKSKRK